MNNYTLSKKHRQLSLEKMSDEKGLDILVIGGGVTGAGIVLDAATRGLRVGIVEAQDWSSGTSSRSSKLVHGGLRYLQMLDFKLVAEALRERELLLHTTAPHLVKPVPFIYPLRHKVWERPYTTCGIGLYDALAVFGSKVHSMPIHKHYTLNGIKNVFPDVNESALIGGIQYYDAKVDDARLVVNLVRTAVSMGAYAASRTQVLGITKSEGGRINGADVEDLETGEKYHIKAKTIINATGVWTEKTQDLAQAEGGLKVLASKGIHIVVPRERLNGDSGFILQTEKSVLFIIPWKRYWIIGTTDTKYYEDLRNPCASEEDIQYVLDRANVILKNPLTRDDVIGSFAGLRPLLQPGTLNGDETKSTKVSREHTVTQVAPGMISIAGGKLTTYRVMAEDAVDFALGAKAKTLPSLTASTPLLGAQNFKVAHRQRKHTAVRYGLTMDRVADLLDRYGDNIRLVLGLSEKDSTLTKPLQHAPEYLRAEIAFACTDEGAIHLEDVMKHRTRLVYEHRDRGLSAVPEIADIMAQYLGWDEKTKKKEIEAYTSQCEAEEKASRIPTEVEAQKVRATAKEITDMH